DVADHHAGCGWGESEKMIEVAANALSGDYARGCFRLWRDHITAGQKLHLQVVCETHFLQQSLLLDGFAHQSRVLNRAADLRGDSSDELDIAGAERGTSGSVGQADSAQQLGAAGLSRPHDGHGEDGTDAKAVIGDVVLG